MRPYHPKLKQPARRLRAIMTDSERRLWSRLRGKQLGVRFYRQKPLGDYVVDFFAPRAGIVVEIDGAQHFETEHMEQDEQRDAFLGQQGLRVLRFHNAQVLQDLDHVVEVICQAVEEGMKSPLAPLS